MNVPSASTTPPLATRLNRIESVDLLRGLVMVVMALDHTRDFFHFGAIHGLDPTNPATTTPLIFLTRWITHFCAPVFSFLAGTGAFLMVLRGKTPRELSWFLVTRGLWLIVIELTYGYLVLTFSLGLHFNIALVLWSLGWSMIVLAALIRLPLWAIAAFGLTLIVGHNAFDHVNPDHLGAWSGLWRILHVQGLVRFSPSFLLFVAYPLVPWIGVMACGYAFGAVFKLEAAAREKWLIGLGLCLTAAFVLLRLGNFYGDPRPWSVQARPGFTVLSFLNTAKYPPSLSFLLMTLGPSILVLGWLENPVPAWLRRVLVFGRVPLFYYLLHLPVVHALAAALHWFQWGRPGLASGATNPPPNAGVGLITVYLVWALVVVAVYPACRWFAGLKGRRRDLPWLSYL